MGAGPGVLECRGQEWQGRRRSGARVQPRAWLAKRVQRQVTTVHAPCLLVGVGVL